MDRENGFERFKAFYGTHPMWRGTLLGLKQFYLSEFKFDDLGDSYRQLPVIPQGTVLGKRAEYYFKFCVDESVNYKCLVNNLQIFKGNRTLGELDYILEDLKSGRRLHVELIYKFYLYRPDLRNPAAKDPMLAELNCYTGPNNRDNLLRKVERLKQHQLPMLYRKQTRDLLASHDIEANDLEQRVCFLAHLFIPCELWNRKFPYVNKACVAGYYLTYSAFAKAETSHSYYLPHKHAWKMQPHALDVSYSHKEVLPVIKKALSLKLAPMVWKINGRGDFERFFVIED